ncbi:DEAD/DEAH box helicase [Pseudoalteromonas umbrosa]|uniref:DEAD/DEAH box helicase n=1 Tax=Pseudoalteromonas umbrosa TaxID=3048489 RepID=UPI0024C39396|nr:DEAD/DEAH box helicase [Pseudoalteromonas sp. B95]MDK1290133.1 DEAD/DEAH box helicase [Pseudoalteromonas sp. B95]
MINPKAIDGFIRAPRDDWRWIKQASLEELTETLSDVPVHTQPYKHQWASIALGVSNPAFMYFLDMGLGKALHVNERVLTPTGWRTIGNTMVGDTLIHPSGAHCQVEGVYPQGSLDLFSVHFDDGTRSICCAEHLWSLCDDTGQITQTLELKHFMGQVNKGIKYHVPLVARHIDFAGNDDNMGSAAQRLKAMAVSTDIEQSLYLARSLGYWASESKYNEILVDDTRRHKTIVSVKPHGHSQAVCIKIDREDGLFITNDFTVTHNTKLLLDLFMYRHARGEAKRALVLVPNFTNIQSWVDEIQVHQPTLKGVGLEGSAKERRALLEADGDVWIINYQGLQSLVTTTENRRRVIDHEALQYTADKFDMVAMDEIHKCKNPESLTFEICDALCESARFRYGLTGTPFGRNPMDLWAQFFLIDRGASLSHHPQIFKETFFDKKVNHMGFVDWEFNKNKKRLLNRMIQNRSIRYRDSECMDLPKQTFIPVRVAMGKDALKYMRDMLEEIQANAMAGGMDERQQVENTFIKMRTLASGFIRVYELDDDGKKTKHYEDIIFKEQPKLDALTDLIGSLPEGEKIVIFHEFIATGEMIEGALKKAAIPYLTLNAQTKDKKAFLHDFRENPKYIAAVVNSKSGSTGLNLQTANHMAFYESPVSPIERQQAEKRTHRGGQKKPCFYYDLVTINSVDERIQDFIKEGKDLMTEIVEQKSNMLLGMMDNMVNDEKQRRSKKR